MISLDRSGIFVREAFYYLFYCFAMRLPFLFCVWVVIVCFHYIPEIYTRSICPRSVFLLRQKLWTLVDLKIDQGGCFFYIHTNLAKILIFISSFLPTGRKGKKSIFSKFLLFFLKKLRILPNLYVYLYPFRYFFVNFDKNWVFAKFWVFFCFLQFYKIINFIKIV